MGKNLDDGDIEKKGLRRNKGSKGYRADEKEIFTFFLPEQVAWNLRIHMEKPQQQLALHAARVNACVTELLRPQ